MNKITKILKERNRSIQYFYVNIPFLIIGELLAEKLEDYSITPNMISISSLFFSSLFSFIIYFYTKSYSLLGVPLILLVGLAFTLDGSLARKKDMTSLFGAWLNIYTEYISYTIIGMTFVYYAYVVNDYRQIILALAFLSFISRQGIYTIYFFTRAAIPNAEEKLFSRELKTAGGNLVSKLKRAFTYNGYMYIYIIIFGIIVKAHPYFLILMAFYGIVSFVGGLIMVGKNIRKFEKKDSE